MTTPSGLVALSFTKGEELVRHVLEAWEEGLAVLPLDPLLPGAAVEKLLDVFRPSRLLSDSSPRTLRGEPVEAGTALVIATSGTSGRPKGVELSHRALDWSARASLDRLGDASGGRWLCCLPLHHIAGLMVVLRARLSGVPPVIHDRFDEAAVEAEADVSLVSLVPSTLVRLLEAGMDLSRFGAILLGGGPAPAGLVESARRAGANIKTTYGMTETCGGCVIDGVPLDGAEVRVAGEQVQLRGPMLFSRYRLREDLTEAALRDGWFHTADRGRFSADGRLEILGRLDDVIVTGGENVSAAEVEGVLLEHPCVIDAAVVGLPSRRWGQVVAAVVVLEPQKRIEDLGLAEFVAARGARYMAPKKLIQVSSVPRGRTGKVLRDEVARLLAGDAAG